MAATTTARHRLSNTDRELLTADCAACGNGVRILFASAKFRCYEGHREQMERRRTRVRAQLAELKGRPCMDCGGTFPPECMDFDHRSGEAKAGNVGNLIDGSPAKLRAEIAKCDLICANCHRIRTQKRRKGIL